MQGCGRGGAPTEVGVENGVVLANRDRPVRSRASAPNADMGQGAADGAWGIGHPRSHQTAGDQIVRIDLLTIYSLEARVGGAAAVDRLERAPPLWRPLKADDIERTDLSHDAATRCSP
jgi:hypothetical protein